MTNLLAILVSLAMLLTGASAPVAEPVSRTLQVSNLTVRHNDEEVTLAPYISMGVATDGAKAIYDFFVGSGDDVYLPFQATVDENGLLAMNDGSKVTVKLDKEQLDALLSDADLSQDDAAIFEALNDYVWAYADLCKLAVDPEATQAIQEKGNAIYDQLVDRGEGVVGTAEYDDVVYDVTTYEYSLNAVQLGALTDALMASDERLAHYSEAYFKLLGVMPEDSGLSDIGSFEALLEKTGVNMTMDITESIAEDGTNFTDAILHIGAEGMEKPLEFVIHSAKVDGEQSSEVSAEIVADDMALDLYMDAQVEGGDMQMGLSMTINPAGEPEEADEEEPETEDESDEEADDEEEDVEDEEEEEPSDDEEVELVDGEGDDEDAYYFTMDFDRDYDEDTGAFEQTLSYTLDAAEQDIHAVLTVDGNCAADGTAACQVSGDLEIGEDAYGFDFDINVNDAPIEDRIDPAAAVPVDELDPTVLMAGVSADALKLYTDESVQKLIAMAQSAMEAATEADMAEYNEAEEVIDEDVTADGLQPAADFAFSDPHFNWLPEGYEVETVNVDAEYQDVYCAIANKGTGDTIYIDIAASYADTDIKHYVLNTDGTYAPIDGVVLNAEVGDGFAIYSMDDGSMSYSVFPSTNDVTIDDVARILTELTFE